MYYPMHACITQYIHVSPSIYMYYPMHACITQYIHVSPSIYMYYPMHACITQYIHVSPSIYMYYPMHACITIIKHKSVLPDTCMYYKVHAWLCTIHTSADPYTPNNLQAHTPMIQIQSNCLVYSNSGLKADPSSLQIAKYQVGIQVKCNGQVTGIVLLSWSAVHNKEP